MWVPERVWEQSLTSDMVDAGIKYTVLDDFHFKNAGLTTDQLHGYYLTEDNGRVLSVFPGSERLRYLIPFAAPHETIEYLREHRRPIQQRGGRIRRRRREIRNVARHETACLRGRLAASFLRSIDCQPRLAADNHVGAKQTRQPPRGAKSICPTPVTAR